MKINQILGLIFIIFGIGLSIFMVFKTTMLFLGNSDFPELFKANEKVVEVQVKETQDQGILGMLQDSLGGVTNDLISNQIDSIIPEGAIEKMFNMSAWMLFAFFMLYAGVKFVDIGIKIMNSCKKP